MENENKGFIVGFKFLKIVDYPGRETLAVYTSDILIGFISTLDVNGEKTITPFTAAGELTEAHCKYCAAKALFANHFSIPRYTFECVSFELKNNTAEQNMKGLLTDLALASLSRR